MMDELLGLAAELIEVVDGVRFVINEQVVLRALLKRPLRGIHTFLNTSIRHTDPSCQFSQRSSRLR